jgi:uncharacterized protein
LIAVDTNILIYAHRVDSPFNARSRPALERLAASGTPWAIPWPVVHEFLAIVTGRAFGERRTPIDIAFATITSWLRHPSCRTIGETADHLAVLAGLVRRAEQAGGAIHDARIAAICLEHGVEEFWTVDRDFSRFPDLRTRNPMIATLQEPVATYAVRRPKRRAPM